MGTDDGPPPPQLQVIAGVNGAGKSSIVGAALRDWGGDYYNPDEAARAMRVANPTLGQAPANAAAWLQGKQLLERAIAERLDFAIETTLGGSTMPRRIEEAAAAGFEVRLWFIGLTNAELHIARVGLRVNKGGHQIGEADIRRRYQHSRLNLVHLLPVLTEARIYDNSADNDPSTGSPPVPILVLHLTHGEIAGPADLSGTPNWAKPIVAAALKLG